MKKTYVLDTNVLLTDPNSIFSFEEHDVVLPFTVLEELDKFKARQDELGVNAREVSRQLSDLIKKTSGNLKAGVKLPGGGNVIAVSSSEFNPNLPKELKPDKNDNIILSVCADLEGSILVTNDLILRVIADGCGIKAEEYRKLSVPSGLKGMYNGLQNVQVTKHQLAELWHCSRLNEDLGKEIENVAPGLLPNEFVHIKNGGMSKPFIVRSCGDGVKFVPEHYELPKVKPRNLEQRLALDLLMDPKVNLVTIVGKAGTGKAQPLETPILTPKGWVKMRDVSIGMKVIGGDGKPTKVLGVFPQGKKPVYRVTFSDGSATECCDEHLWLTQTQLERDHKRSGKIRELSEIQKTLRYGKRQKRNHSIPMVKPVEFEKQKVELDPYVLGVMLGDGSMSQRSIVLTTKDAEIASMCNEKLNIKGDMLNRISNIEYRVKRIKRNNKLSFLAEQLEKMHLLGKCSHEKFIPAKYKYNTPKIRLAVLQGLMDTDGTVSKDGTYTSFTSTSKQLVNDVQELVWSFGGKATRTTRVTSYIHNEEVRQGKPSYRLSISMPANVYPFRLVRKLIRFKPRTKYQPTRYIDKVELIGEKETQCILVDNEDHLYVTNDYIITHNTLLALAAGLEQVVDKRKYKSLVVLRPVQPLGKDIGYLPGSKEEKMEPWIAPIKDNLRFLLTSDDGRKSKHSENSLNHYFERGIIEVEALTYIRGRSIAEAYMIIDEAQNLSVHELKTIITRVGDGTKIVLTGDVEQIDNMYVDSVSNGLAVAVERFKEHLIAGHITLTRGERSELATLAARIL